MVKQRFRNQVLDCKTYPGTRFDSDHNMVIMKCRMKFKRLKRKRRPRRWDVDKLKEKQVQLSFDRCVDKELRTEDGNTGPGKNWDLIKSGTIKAAEKTVGLKKWRARSGG